MMHQNEIENFKQKFDLLIADKKSIMIVAHKGPDDDSVGSMLSVYRYLKRLYPEKNVEVFTFSIPEVKWESFEDFKIIKFVTDEVYDFSRFDFLIGVDASQFSRFHPNPEFFNSFKGESVCIDHHKNATDSFTESLVLGDYTSNSELIHNIFYFDGIIDPISAELMLLGILGDTGNFRFVNYTQSDVFLVAKRLVDAAKLNIQAFMARYGTYPERTFLTIQEVVKNAKIVEIEGWPRMVLSYIDRKLIAEKSFDDGEISAATHIFIAQYGLSLTECSWAMVFSPRDDGSVSVSMRSRVGSVNVRMIGQQTGKGGGHDRASGLRFIEEGKIFDSQECIDWVKIWMKENKPVLE